METLCQREVDDIPTTGTISSNSGATDLSAQTLQLQVHQPWYITWQSTDTSTLSPSLPTLTNAMYVPTWVAGEIIPDGEYDVSHPGDGPRFGPLAKFTAIGVPLIGVAIIGGLIWCCIGARRRKRKEEQLKLEMALQQSREEQDAPEAREQESANSVST
jgi:hypothetical protein